MPDNAAIPLSSPTEAQARLFSLLSELGIEHVTVCHAPTFTVAQSQELRARLPGAHSKTLFLTNKEGKLVLVAAKDDTRADLKSLAAKLGTGRLSFVKPERLSEVLGVTPGSVALFALINDASGRIDFVVVDTALAAADEVNFHPLVNNATTRIASADLLHFIEACGHRPRVLSLG